MGERRNLVMKKLTFYQLISIHEIKLIYVIVFAMKYATEKIQYLKSKCELCTLQKKCTVLASRLVDLS